MQKKNRGGSRYLPFVFTEQGVAQLSTVLHSDKAVQISIGIMRGFAHLRTRWMQNHIDLAPKLELLQSSIEQIQQRLNQIGTNSQTCAVPTVVSRKPNRAALIQDAVAGFWGLRSEDLKSQARAQPITLARQIAVFIMRKHLGMGFSEIGLALGGRDHSTIIHAYRKIHVHSEENEAVKKVIAAILKEVQPLVV